MPLYGLNNLEDREEKDKAYRLKLGRQRGFPSLTSTHSGKRIAGKFKRTLGSTDTKKTTPHRKRETKQGFLTGSERKKKKLKVEKHVIAYLSDCSIASHDFLPALLKSKVSQRCKQVEPAATLREGRFLE